MGNALLTCPFCGQTPMLVKNPMWQGSHGYYGCYGFSVKCENEDCAITPFTRTFDTIYEKDEKKQKEKAIAAWNRRADAVQVVRCENCNHYNRMGCSDGFGWCERMDRGTNDDFYCSLAERKEEHHEDD